MHARSVAKAILCLLLSLGLVHGQSDFPAQSKEYPLYEDVPILRDYRVNQSLLDAAKFGVIGAPLLGLVGYLIEGESEFPILTAMGLVAGGSLGAVAGGVFGFVKGDRYNDRKRDDARFHARTRRVGLEFGGMVGPEKDGPAIALIYKDRSRTPYYPDEFVLEWSVASWGGDTSIFVETKYALSFAYRSLHKVLSPVYGAGIGYTRGYEDPSRMIDNKLILHRKKRGVLLHTFLGLKLNLFDLCHAGVLVDFQPFGLYNYYEGYGNYPLGNFTLKGTLGAYLF